jgi:hypothetical protein
MLFKEIITVYSGNNIKPINTLWPTEVNWIPLRYIYIGCGRLTLGPELHHTSESSYATLPLPVSLLWFYALTINLIAIPWLYSPIYI